MGNRAVSDAPGQQLRTSIDESAQLLTHERRKNAAIRVYCIDASRAAENDWEPPLHSKTEFAECDLVAFTKVDEAAVAFGGGKPTDGIPAVRTSSRTGEGLKELCEALGGLLSRVKSADRGQVIAATADRCRESVRSAQASLLRAAELITIRGGNELVAVELRAALEQIGRVVGAVYTNDLLDRIFGTFCIGK
jgi:tRNA modification GTPase